MHPAVSSLAASEGLQYTEWNQGENVKYVNKKSPNLMRKSYGNSGLTQRKPKTQTQRTLPSRGTLNKIPLLFQMVLYYYFQEKKAI